MRAADPPSHYTILLLEVGDCLIGPLPVMVASLPMLGSVAA